MECTNQLMRMTVRMRMDWVGLDWIGLYGNRYGNCTGLNCVPVNVVDRMRQCDATCHRTNEWNDMNRIELK